MNVLEIEPSAPSSPDLASFLSAWPYLPHRRGWRGEPGSLATLAATRVQPLLEAPDSHCWTARKLGRTAGFAVLRPLAWDSHVLGVAAARLELYVAGDYARARDVAASLLDAAAQAARTGKLRHLSVRVDAADDAAIHALEAAGYLNVDALVTFGAAPADLPAPLDAAGVEIRLASAGDAAAVAEIAGASFVDGRFHADPSIPPDRAREVYRRWAAACCEGAAADAVVVARVEGRVAGFVACRIQRDTAVFLQGPAGTIPLIAVSGSARGRGVGAGLIARAGAWFAGERAAMIEVGTQIRNIAAARLYETTGFRLVNSALSFRSMIDA